MRGEERGGDMVIGLVGLVSGDSRENVNKMRVIKFSYKVKGQGTNLYINYLDQPF